MKINEVEEHLAVTRANVRYYEKEGLIKPKRDANGYRNYSENDVETLRKIIIFRKIGLSIDNIKDILSGKVILANVLEENSLKLQKQMDDLAGAMEVCRIMERELTDAENFDTKRYWNLIQNEEKEGHNFFDYVKDYADYEQGVLESVLKNSFLYDFKKRRQKYGFKIAFVILLIVCGVRGLCVQFLWKSGSFIEGFLYPFVIFTIVSVISFPIYVLNKKYGLKKTEDCTKPDKKTLSALFSILWFGFILAAIFILEMGVPVAAEKLIYPSLLQKEYECMNSGLYVLYAVTGIGAVGLLYWIFAEQIMGRIPCVLPKRVKIKAVVYVVIIYIIVLIAYLGWYDCFTKDGAIMRRMFYEKEYRWEQAESFDITSQRDGTLEFIVTMDDGTQLKPMDESCSSGDNEAFVRYLVQKLANDGIKCQVRDWKQLRDSLGQYEYWQEYMDELRKIIENTGESR